MTTLPMSKATAGQDASSVIARTLDIPSGPSWTHCARIFASAPAETPASTSTATA